MRVQGLPAPMTWAPSTPGKTPGTGFADLLAGPPSNHSDSAKLALVRLLQGDGGPAGRLSPPTDKDGAPGEAAPSAHMAMFGISNLSAQALLPPATAPAGSIPMVGPAALEGVEVTRDPTRLIATAAAASPTGPSFPQPSGPLAIAASSEMARQPIGQAFRLDELGMFGTVGPTSDAALPLEGVQPIQSELDAAASPALSAEFQPASIGALGTAPQETPLTEAAIVAGPETQASLPDGVLAATAEAAVDVQPAATATPLASATAPDLGNDPLGAAPTASFDQPPALAPKHAGSLIVSGPLQALQVVIGAPNLSSVPEALKDAMVDAAASYGGSIADLAVNGRSAATSARRLSGGSNGRPS